MGVGNLITCMVVKMADHLLAMLLISTQSLISLLRRHRKEKGSDNDFDV